MITGEILNNLIAQSIRMQSRQFGNSSPEEFINNYQIIDLTLPRRSGKSTAIRQSFRLGSDIILTKNEGMALDMQKELQAKSHDKLVDSSSLHGMEDQFMEQIDRTIKDSILTIDRFFPHKRARHDLFRDATEFDPTHSLFCDYRVIFTDEIGFQQWSEYVDPFNELRFNLYQRKILNVVVTLST